MPFEALKNFKHKSVWERLSKVRPEPGMNSLEALYEFDPEFAGIHTIYHYTNVGGLQGILQSNRLWATAAYYLNDASEVEYGCQIVRQELELWREANESNNGFAVDLLRNLDALFRSPHSRLSRSTTIFVTCFCEHDNLLSQWRAYGQNGGYSLGFEVRAGKIAVKSPGWFWDSRLVRVIYDTRTQRQFISSILKQSLEAVSEIKRVSIKQRSDLMKEALLYVEELILNQIVAFKNPAFGEEREWRLVIRPNLIGEHLNAEAGEGPGFRFRGVRGSLVPYLELIPDGERLPITSVRFGPSLDVTRIRDSVSMLLASCGFGGVQLRSSEIPVIL